MQILACACMHTYPLVALFVAWGAWRMSRLILQFTSARESTVECRRVVERRVGVAQGRDPSRPSRPSQFQVARNRDESRIEASTSERHDRECREDDGRMQPWHPLEFLCGWQVGMPVRYRACSEVQTHCRPVGTEPEDWDGEGLGLIGVGCREGRAWIAWRTSTPPHLPK